MDKEIAMVVITFLSVLGGGGGLLYLRSLRRRLQSMVERGRTHVVIVRGHRPEQADEFARLVRASGLRVSVTDRLPGPTLAQVGVLMGPGDGDDDYIERAMAAFPVAVAIILYRAPMDMALMTHSESNIGEGIISERQELGVWSAVQSAADMVGASRVFAGRKHGPRRTLRRMWP